MSAKKRGLGKGFDAIIPGDMLADAFDVTATQDDRVSELRKLPLDEIFPDAEQPRHHFDEDALAELTASIREHGILQPLVVVPRAEGGYTIVAGERRYRAATRAGLNTVPALIRTLSDQHKLELSLIENIQRKDLNPLETAVAYAKLRDQFNLSLEQIGARLGGKSVSAVSNAMRLLKLPEQAQHALANGTLSEGQARPLINADASLVARLLPTIIAEQWPARQVEAAVAEQRTKAPQTTTKPARAQYAHDKTYASKLEQKLQTKASIARTARGSGTIKIAFANDDELARLLDQLS